MRIVQFAVLGNHVHLVVEASSQAARAGDERLRRSCRAWPESCDGAARGRVLGDRYHSHVLHTPLEARNAVRYVRLNALKHGIATHPTHDAYVSRGRRRAAGAAYVAASRAGPTPAELSGPRAGPDLARARGRVFGSERWCAVVRGTPRALRHPMDAVNFDQTRSPRTAATGRSLSATVASRPHASIS